MIRNLIKKAASEIIIALVTFLILITIILYLYNVASNNYNAVIESQTFNTGRLLSKEFNRIIKSDISRLENLKNRLEFTNGEYYVNWEKDATLLLQQNPSFKFIEWIDSSMVIKKINPFKGNEIVIGLDISKLEYRKNEWINHSKNGKTNITSWLKLTQSGHSFLVDIPVYFNNRFQGTITAGMDFTTNFNRLVSLLENQCVIELRDDKGILFYKTSENNKLKTKKDIVFTNTLLVDAADQQAWSLKVFPSKKLLMVKGKNLINIVFLFGLFLALMASFLVYFYLRARQGTKLAVKSNLDLIKLNEKLNTERNRAEKASQAKTDFLSNMSHEIRTPLHAIIGFIQLLKGHKLNRAEEEYVDLMDKSSSNLLNIINDILDIDKIESGTTELYEVFFSPLEKTKELIAVNQFLFLNKNLYLKTNFGDAPGISVMGDQNKLLQIVNNILKNALKFTDKGGVELTYDEIRIKNQLKIIITIEDTGIGIPKEKIDTIFKRFTQIDSSIKKQHQGSGLGLAICKNLVTMIGGDITVESELGKGSKFQISALFKIPEKQETQDISKIKKDINLLDLNVLIVDDNNLNIIVLKKMIENIGIKADVAENGKIAIEKAEKKDYQLIFMDIHMPIIDGWEAAKTIRNHNNDVVIIGLSANVTTEAINKAINSGMNNYLFKPFKKEHLYKLLAFHFNK